MFVGRRDRVIFVCLCIMSLDFAKVRKTKSVEFLGVWIDPFIRMSSGARRDRDGRARGKRHTVGKCKWTQHETVHRYWEEAESELVLGVPRRESNERTPKPSSRWVSRMKLSILYILSSPAFVQPSSLMAAPTSSRRGSRYSGLARRRYKTCVAVY